MAVSAVEPDVEPGLFQDADLALLAGLAPDELLDVRVSHVEDDHFGGPAGCAPALDGARRGIGTTHEADRPAGLASSPQGLSGGSDGT